MRFTLDQPIAAPLARAEEAFVDPAFYKALGTMPNIGDPDILEEAHILERWVAGDTS